METRIGILLSGRGSNMVALAKAVADGEVPGRIVCVASNVEGAAGLDRARELDLNARAVPQTEYESRYAHEAALLELLDATGVEWLCLAGYMRLLSAEFVRRFDRRLVNIHPSLLPSFPGLHAQRQAIEAGVKVSGCTVHFVDQGLDSGPIVAQRAVAIEEGDDEGTLAARILVEEHRLYPEALRRLLSERWSIRDRTVRFDPSGP